MKNEFISNLEKLQQVSRSMHDFSTKYVNNQNKHTFMFGMRPQFAPQINKEIMNGHHNNKATNGNRDVFFPSFFVLFKLL